MPIKNNRYRLRINGLGSNGEGVGRLDGFTMFVEGALPGEMVEILAVKIKKTYGYGKLLSVIEPSPERVTPVCSVFGKCGGCKLQHMSYASQLEYKREKASDALKRIGGIDCPVEPAFGMEKFLGYRNKAQFPAGQGPVFGFYASRSHRLVPITECALQHGINSKILAITEEFIRRRGISVYDEEARTGIVRHIMTRVGFSTGEIMVCVVVNGDKLPHADELARELRRLDGMTGIVLNINKAQTNVILGRDFEIIWGKGFITDTIGECKFRISPRSFFQVNPGQTERLYSIAAEYAELTAEDTALDLYCGIGSIALFIAGRVKKVYGIEIIPEAIADARVNAELNGITNAEFICGAAEVELPALKLRPDVIFLDPPRKGCDPRVLSEVVKSGVNRLVYISCDPATMARDVKLLAACGYSVKRVRPVDLFPMTPHVETCALLLREKDSAKI